MSRTIRNHHAPLRLALGLAGALTLAGCSSIEGNKLIRSPDGAGVTTNSVGGLPITVKIPKKALFFVTKSTYRQSTESTTVDDNGVVQNVRSLPIDIVEVHVDKTPVLLGPTETYTIDPKRPAFGTIDYAVDLTEQYPTKIKGKVDDDTLDVLRTLVENLAKQLVPVPGGGIVKQAGDDVRLIKTLVSQEVLVYTVDLESGQATTTAF